MIEVERPKAPVAEPTAARGEGGSHKLWGGRFATGPAEALDRLNRSIGTDFRLWPHDVRLSKAWAVALWQGGVLSLAALLLLSRFRALDAEAGRREPNSQSL